MAQDIFFTSDHHFGHANVIEFCKRPFTDVMDMREALIARHNEVVKKGDLVYILGDMFWRSTDRVEALEILDRMNGQKYYVWGNHEERVEELYGDPRTRGRFIWYRDLTQIHPAGCPKIVLCHYAMRVWNGSHKGAWQLYGHSHNGLSKSVAGQSVEESPLSMDVGVDTHDYYPWHIDEVAHALRTQDASWQKITLKCQHCGHTFIDTTERGAAICVKCSGPMIKER